jgi:hypothetical protein
MKVILFGATGMVGQGVLRECLRDETVDNVLVIGRNSIGQIHPKLRELRRPDMFDFGGVAVELQGYDACFFCLGVSAAGTGGNAMWAQVKGRTENALLSLFPHSYMFRLLALRPMHGEESKTRWTRISYALFHPLLPLVRAIVPGAVITTEELGRAMIRAAREGAPKRVLENRDLIALGALGGG